MNTAKIYTLSEGSEAFDTSHALPEVIKRFEAKGFPLHIGVHQFDADDPVPDYCAIHRHTMEDEINIIISQGDFEYAICVGNDIYKVTQSSAIWIPAGVNHSANVLKGSGTFICLRLPTHNA